MPHPFMNNTDSPGWRLKVEFWNICYKQELHKKIATGNTPCKLWTKRNWRVV